MLIVLLYTYLHKDGRYEFGTLTSFAYPVEGSEDDIRANSYVVAFQREHDEEKGELNWKMVDFMPNGAVAYI